MVEGGVGFYHTVVAELELDSSAICKCYLYLQYLLTFTVVDDLMLILSWHNHAHC